MNGSISSGRRALLCVRMPVVEPDKRKPSEQHVFREDFESLTWPHMLSTIKVDFSTKPRTLPPYPYSTYPLDPGFDVALYA